MARRTKAPAREDQARLDQECVIALFRAADALRGHFSGVVGAEGLTLQQYNVLRILRGAGPEGLPTLEVAHRMMERAPGITRMIDRLERGGWVIRERSETDRRCVYCRITPGGLKLLEALDEPVRAADREALEMLTRKERVALRDALDRMTERLRGAEEESGASSATSPRNSTNEKERTR